MATKLNIADIIKQLQKQQDKANKANLERYGQGLGELTGTRGTMRGLYDQAGEGLGLVGRQATQDIDRGALRSMATGRQQLISSGLGNTTIQGNLLRAVEEDRRRAMQGVEEQQGVARMGLSERRAGMEGGAGGSIASFIANRNDIAPDLGAWGSLIQAGQAGANSQPVSANAGLGSSWAGGRNTFTDPTGNLSISTGGGGGGGMGPIQSAVGEGTSEGVRTIKATDQAARDRLLSRQKPAITPWYQRMV